MNTKHHVWAEKYDADLADVFDVQDKITESIVAAIFPAIRSTETRRALGGRSVDLNAWDHLLLGRYEIDRHKKEGNRRAIEHLNAALAIDPGYSAVHSALAAAYFMDFLINAAQSREDAAEMAHAEARKAIDLDDRDAMAHALLAYAHLPFGRLDAMEISARRAIELNPSLVYGHHSLGLALYYSGELEQGLKSIDEAIALAPHDPAMAFILGGKAMAHLFMHDFDSAIRTARNAIGLKYGYLLGRVLLVSALAHNGDIGEARNELGVMFEVQPDFSTALLEWYPLRDVDRTLLYDGLDGAGLNEL
jgi:tetratricopeptide (TPR) repeat protein